MTPDQQAILDRAVPTLAADPRVRSVWLSGSLGRGQGDVWSDVDLTVSAAAADLPALIEDFRRPRADMPAQVFSQLVHGRIVSTITPDWSRLDIAFVTPEELAAHDGAGLRRLGGALDPAPPAPMVATDDPKAPARVLALGREFLRVLGMSPIAVGRQEWIVARQGFEILYGLTISLCLEENGAPPGSRGAKRLNPYLTDEQRAALEAVAPPRADRASVLAANQAIARLFLPRARRLAARLGVVWPSDFEVATRHRLSVSLDLAI